MAVPARRVADDVHYSHDVSQLRHHSFAAIGRAVGVSKVAAINEQERMYEVLAAARKRVEAADIETTATTETNGPERSLTINPPDTEHTEE